jgi:hypothetical protein
LKIATGELRGMMANEEGTFGIGSVVVDGSGVHSFLYVINGIFLVGERVGDKLTNLEIIWVVW